MGKPHCLNELEDVPILKVCFMCRPDGTWLFICYYTHQWIGGLWHVIMATPLTQLNPTIVMASKDQFGPTSIRESENFRGGISLCPSPKEAEFEQPG